MFNRTINVSTVLVSAFLLSSIVYGKTVPKDPVNIPQDSNYLMGTKQNMSIEILDQRIENKQLILLGIAKSHIKKYTSLYDEIAELSISKNRLLIDLDRGDDIDTDKTCDLASKYEEIEFIKTEYYKTPFHHEVAKTLKNIALLYEQCHPPLAEKYLKSMIKIQENLYTKKSDETAKAYDKLGDYYRIDMADFQKAIQAYEKAKAIRENLYDSNDPRITENYERLANSLYYHGDKNNNAQELLLRSVAIREQAPPNINFPLYIAYMDLGIFYSMRDTYDKSIIYLQKARKTFKGKINSQFIVIVSELSQNYLNQNDLQNALKYAEEAYRLSKTLYGDDTHIQVLQNYGRLSEIRDRIKQEH